MMLLIRTLATSAALAVILITGVSVANAAPGDDGLVITTIPKVPGFQVTIDDETEVTDESGIAQFKTRKIKNLNNRLKSEPQELELDGREVRVESGNVRWKGNGAHIWINKFWPVRFSFIDVNGEPIDVDRVESVQLKSQTGELVEASAKGVTWLHGLRVVSLGGGPEEKTIPWSIQEVNYASSNVVNSSQQRFEPAETEEVVVELLFYRTKVIVKDAFFGFPIGDAVLVTSPDGRVDRFPLAENGTVNLPSLPRGDYSIVVEGPGPLMARPVAISRNQVLDLKFYSWLDIGLVGGFLTAFAVGTLGLGWWRRRANNSGVEDNRANNAVVEDNRANNAVVEDNRANNAVVEDNRANNAVVEDEPAPTIQMPINGASDASVPWTHPPWESTAPTWPPSAGRARRALNASESRDRSGI
jgi:hypothetical protein